MCIGTAPPTRFRYFSVSADAFSVYVIAVINTHIEFHGARIPRSARRTAIYCDHCRRFTFYLRRFYASITLLFRSDILVQGKKLMFVEEHRGRDVARLRSQYYNIMFSHSGRVWFNYLSRSVRVRI